jgi:hypothetical protein
MRNLVVFLRRRLQLSGGLAPVGADKLLLEDSSFILLETSDKLLLE